jgi:bacteriocin-like protein
MLRKTKTHKRKPSPDTLLKTAKKGEVELTEKDLEKVSGGGKVSGSSTKLFTDAVAGDLSTKIKF